MGIRPFKDDTYDELLWTEIWTAVWQAADAKNLTKKACVDTLSVDADLSPATIWRCIDEKKFKWRDDTREKLYRYAGYDSIDAFRKKIDEQANANADPAEESAPSEPIQLAEKKCRHNMPLRPSHFLGRKEMLNDIHQKLRSQRCNILLLSGIGGMGKTTLMQEYLYTDNHKDHFENIIAISVNRNLESAFISGADQALNIGVKDIIPTEEKLNAITATMASCKGENLFIIDNVNECDHDDLLRMKHVFNTTHWKFLVTTRTAPDDFEKMPVDELNTEDAVLLFAYHYAPDNVMRNDEACLKQYIEENKLGEQIEKLVTHSVRHTLLTELLAKTGKKKGISVLQLLNILKDEDLKNKELERTISIGRHATHAYKQELSQTTLYNYILSLFETDYLVKPTGSKAQDIENKEKVSMLQFFSVLPSEDILVEDLKTLWAMPTDTENIFEDRLDELKQIGWLQGKQENSKGYNQNITFSMHPLVQEVVYDKLKPTINSCRPLVINLTAILRQIDSYPQKFQNYTKSVVDKLNFLKTQN